MPDELLNERQAAAVLGVRPSTLRAWRAQKRIAYVKLNRAVRYRRPDLQALVVASLVPAEAKPRPVEVEP